MNDDQKKVIGSRPLDPTRNAEDVLGESGATGVTNGGTQQTSATPSDVEKDDTRIRGGELVNAKGGMSQHIDPTLYSDAAYNKQALQGMSGLRKQINSDQASEKEKGKLMQELADETNGNSSELRTMGNDTQEDAERDITTTEASFTHDHNLGQQDGLGGSESAPESIVDVGEAQERMGLGVDKDGDDPQEVSIADAIDKAEDEHLHS